MAGELSEGAAVTQLLAQFVARTHWSDLPQPVRHEALRSLVNIFATALAGCGEETVAIASRVFERFSAGRSCTVIGRGERTDMLNAASLNAMGANVFDFDDTHLPTIIHPTAPVAPALFALAEVRSAEGRPVTGEDLLLAFVLGVEVECRIGNAISPGHYGRGWHITSTCGVFGSAMAAGKIFGLDAQQLGWALGNASAQAGGLVETLGSSAKSVSVGNAARNGLLSALLAAEGFAGPAQPLEGPRGFLRVFGEISGFDASLLTRGLGERWELMANTYKPYPCGVVLNPVIEACLHLHLHSASAFQPGDIERIEVEGHPLLRQRTDRPGPATGRESQVSAQHAVAVTLTRGRAGLEEFDDASVALPELRGLGSRLAFIDDEKYGVESAKVIVQLRGGETVSHTVKAARGSLSQPLRDSDLEEKLRTLCAYGGSGCDAEALIGALWSLASSRDAAGIMPLAAGRAS